jgi:glyoxylase-like metal-dependent hydrolase (beta-lactamase superfamily II)
VAERIQFKPPWSPVLEKLADGVWVVRGDLKRAMNVYLLEDEGGVTAFDAGTKPMVGAVRNAAAKLGGLKRVVLGHSHSDHRGTAPYLGVPVYCHPNEQLYAEKPTWRENAPYWGNHELIEVPHARWLYNHVLHDRWDGGAVEITGTVSEGDRVCGFEVVDFPGHSPGLIGLWRDSDRLCLTSDTVYYVDSARLREIDHPTLPHRAFNWDQEKARESLRKLAGMKPATVASGHEATHSEPDLPDRLLKAADAG